MPDSPIGDTNAPSAKRRRILADTRPLKESVPFRWCFTGHTFSMIGSQISLVATAVQVYDLTHSSFAVGLISLFAFLPMIPFGLMGGSMADAFDRRKLVIWTSAGMAFVSSLLAFQAFFEWRQLWLIYALVALQQSLYALDRPAQSSFLPRLLANDQLAPATALIHLTANVSFVVGPFVAGVLIATGGLEAAYLVDAFTFVMVLLTTMRLPAMAKIDEGEHGPGLRSVVTGLRFVRSNKLIGAAMLADINLTVLAFPHALFPALADTHFGGGAHTVGWLYAAPGLGGLIAAFFSGPVGHVRRQGSVVLASIAVFAVAVMGVGLTSTLWVAVVCLMVTGASDVLVSVFRATILQTNTPDHMRGRLNGLDLVVGGGGPRLGNIRAGSVASIFSPVTSLVVGGATCLVGVSALALFAKNLRDYEARDAAA